MSEHHAREHARVDLRLSAEVHLQRADFTAVTRNLSEGGAALECDRPLADGEQFNLSLFLVVEGVEDEQTPPLQVWARVMWTAEGDDGTHAAGVRFERMTPAQTAWLARVLSIAPH
ncbi:MAG: PilZ domain-containing protein [Deltaproteobacteria bacterium]|nr:PilZ domain-containing protein [Deltaproteobacteria bacterium]